jgi:hypothetical protein
MKRAFLALITLVGLVPALVRWVTDGQISVGVASLLAVLVTLLIALDGISFRIVVAMIAVVGFGLHYGSDGNWRTFGATVLELAPLIICLFGFYVIFNGAIPNRRGDSRKT